MSVLDKETVDGIALDRDGNGIRLLITDHLDWGNEHNHLLIAIECHVTEVKNNVIDK